MSEGTVIAQQMRPVAERRPLVEHALVQLTLVRFREWSVIDEAAVESMMRGLDTIREQGGEVLYGGERKGGGCYVTPALVRAHPGGGRALTRFRTWWRLGWAARRTRGRESAVGPG